MLPEHVPKLYDKKKHAWSPSRSYVVLRENVVSSLVMAKKQMMLSLTFPALVGQQAAC